MAEQPKQGQKPTGPIEAAQIAQGLVKPPVSTAEVSGHGIPAGGFQACWHCHTVNWVPSGSVHFRCRNCGNLVTINW